MAVALTPSPSGRGLGRGNQIRQLPNQYPLILVAPGILPPATLVHPCTSARSRREKGFNFLLVSKSIAVQVFQTNPHKFAMNTVERLDLANRRIHPAFLDDMR